MARLLLFGGKGGVGKTTTSAATAIWLAECGLNVLLVSSDPAHSTSDSLGVQLNSEPEIIDGFQNLWGLEMNPEGKLSTLLPKLGKAVDGMNSPQLSGLSMFLDPDAKDEMSKMKEEIQTDELILPGLDEALAFDELLRHMENPAWDVVIFDTAPTGHTLRFLSLPELIDTWSDRLLRMLRISGGLRSMLFGRKQSDELKEELERFRNRVIHIRNILNNPHSSSFTLVTIPERMGVNETIRAHHALSQFKIPVHNCLINRLTPDIDHPFIQTRFNEEQKRVEELKTTLEHLNVGTVEVFETEVHGIEMLRQFGKSLYGELVSFENTIGPHEFGNVLHHSIHRGMVQRIDENVEHISLHLPDLDRSSLSLRCEAGILFINMNGRDVEIPTDFYAKRTLINASSSGDILNIDIPKSSKDENHTEG